MKTLISAKPAQTGFWRSIQGTLLLLLLLLLLPAILIQFYIYHAQSQARRAEELQANLEVARATARNFDSFLRDIIHSELVIGLALTASQPVTDQDRNRILDQFQADNPAVRSVSWINSGGLVVASSHRPSLGYDFSDRSFYQEVLAGRDWAVSELVLGKVTGKPTFVISRGIRNEQGEPLGIIAAAVDSDRLDSIMGIERLGDAGVSLVDNKGMHVYRYPPAEYTWEQRNWLKLYPLMENALNGKEVTSTVISGFTGKKRLVGFVPVSSIGWVAAASRAEEEAMEPLTSSLVHETILYIAVILAAFFGVLLLSRFIAIPIKKLRDQALQFGSGERDIPALDSGPSEVKDLAVVFQEMAKKVRSHQFELMASEEKFRTLFDSVPEPLALAHWDEATILEVNEAYCRFLGFSRDEVLGRTFVDLGIWPDSIEPTQIRDILTHKLGVSNFECRLRTKSGEIKTVLLSAETVFMQPQYRVLFIIKDITERKRAEDALRESHERLNLALESARAGTWDRDIVADKSTWDDFLHQLFGLAPGTFPGKLADFLSLLHPDDRARVEGALAEAFRTGHDYAATYRVVWPDSSVHFIGCRGRIYHDRNGLAVRMIGACWDIAELKRAEEELRESEARFRGLVEGAPEAIFVQRGGRFVYINAAMADLLGASTPEELLGKEFMEWIAPEYREAVRERIQFQSETGKAAPLMEQEYLRLDGSRVPVETTAMPIQFQGSDAHMVFIRDITERKQAAEALRESEAKFRTIFENMQDVFYRTDREGNLVLLSPSGARLLGLDSADQSYGMNVAREFYAIPKERDRILQTLEANGTVSDYDVTLKRPDGSLMFVSTNSRIYRDVDGEPLGVEGVFRDINERKRSEEAVRRTEENFRRSLDESPLGVRIVTAEGETIYANRAILNIYGYDSIEDLRTIPAKERYTPESYAEFQARREKRKEGDSDPSEYEVSIVRKDGEVRHLRVIRKQTLWDGERQFQVIYRDITERKQAEREKEELEIQLRQAQKLEAIGTLAGGIAHDFNNILGIIMGYVELVGSKLLEESRDKRNLDEVLKACVRAKGLVQQILVFSRMDTGIGCEPVSLPIVLNDTLGFLRASLPTTIEIRWNISAKDVLVSANVTHIQQVVTNLCTNSAHAMEETGGILEVSLTEVDFDPGAVLPHGDLKPGPYVKLTVGDSGHGMDAWTLERIFDPYFTTKAPGKGTGLGLAVVQGIVKHHEGAITVRSELGKGTTFDVYLPRNESQATTEVEALEFRPKGTERILFVDDETALADIGRMSLEPLGYAVVTMTDSVEALELFRAQPEEFDLVITDYTMPRMTGVELAQEMMRIRPDIPVILCTGYNNMISEAAAKTLGIRAFLVKPVGVVGMAKIIRKVLKSRES